MEKKPLEPDGWRCTECGYVSNSKKIPGHGCDADVEPVAGLSSIENRIELEGKFKSSQPSVNALDTLAFRMRDEMTGDAEYFEKLLENNNLAWDR